jgi:hypothetical protein
LIGSLLQERVSYFAIKMLLLQRASITEQNMRVNILETVDLAKPEELIVTLIINEVILNSV